MHVLGPRRKPCSAASPLTIATLREAEGKGCLTYLSQERAGRGSQRRALGWWKDGSFVNHRKDLLW
jgi:hypothetical protein